MRTISDHTIQPVFIVPVTVGQCRTWGPHIFLFFFKKAVASPVVVLFLILLIRYKPERYRDLVPKGTEIWYLRYKTIYISIPNSYDGPEPYAEGNLSTMGKFVIKHSAATQISNHITLLQRRGWNVLLENAYENLLTRDEHKIGLTDFKTALRLEDSKNYQHVKKFLKALVGYVVEWNVLEKDKTTAWVATSLLSRVEIRDGYVYYAYDSKLAARLHHPEMYARISLSLQNRFSSKHALALYELCVDYYIAKRKHGFTQFIPVNEFRALMGLHEGQYHTYKTLNQWVIKPAITEINDKSDLMVEVDYRREHRRITALKFHIKPNPKPENQVGFKPALPKSKPVKPKATSQQHSDNTDQIDPAEKVLLDAVVSHGTDVSLGRQAIKDHGLTGANEILTSAIARPQVKSKRNFAAYLAQAFRCGWGLKSPEKRAEEQRKAENLAARSAKFEKAQTEKLEQERATARTEAEQKEHLKTEWDRLDAMVELLPPDKYNALKAQVSADRDLNPGLLKTRMRKAVEKFLQS